MNFQPSTILARVARRDLLLAVTAAALPVWATGQTQAAKKPTKIAEPAKRGKPMTAAEEALAAKAVAESIADQTGEPAHPAVGTTLRMPTSFKLFDGQDFSEAQAKGKLLIVFYWASWCPICKVVEPRLHDFWLKNRAKGVEVLALSTDTEVQPAFAHIQKTGWKFPVSMATAAKMGDAMQPRSLPTTMVRSKNGVIVSVDEGEIDADEFKDFLIHL
jgi:peroxiredoxin